MTRKAIAISRAALIALAVGSLLAQVLAPLLASETGRLYPEVAHVVVPYSIGAVAAIACLQVCLVAMWQLLSMIANRRVFEQPALRWLASVRVAAATACAIPALVMMHLLFGVGVGGPGIVLTLAADIVGGVGLAMALTIARELLRIAIDTKVELSEVI